MTIDSMKNIKFAASTYEDWKEGAEAALKGKPFDASLKTGTIEGIELEPLYTAEMTRGLDDQARIVQASKTEAGWRVAQEVEADSAADFLAKMTEDISRGNEMVVYTSAAPIAWSEAELEQLAELIQQYPIYFKITNEDQDILRVFEKLPEQGKGSVTGVIASERPVDAPSRVRTQAVNLVSVHQAGGTIVQELGVALSMIAERAEKETLDALAPKLWMRFAVDTHFFQEIAKLRAFRVLWKAFQTAYGKELPAPPVFTETSVRSYSKLDPYVNLLRGGNATFAAVLGGTDAHTMHPHDILTGRDASSMRIARNVQLVIKEETHVNKVADPSAGSFFIETLTKQYVDEAWNYFLRIEEQGGYSEIKKSGWLADELQAAWAERERQAAVRKTSLIGTNVYANPQEPVKAFQLDDRHAEYMAAKRLSAPFEKLREQGKETIVKTAVVLLEPLKAVKPQADFVSGVLAVAGIEPLMSGHLQNAEELNGFLEREAIDYAVLCGKPETLQAVIPQLKTSAAVDVAGGISKEQLAQWQPFGIRGAVYSGMQLTNKLEEIVSFGKEALEDDEA